MSTILDLVNSLPPIQQNKKPLFFIQVIDISLLSSLFASLFLSKMSSDILACSLCCGVLTFLLAAAGEDDFLGRASSSKTGSTCGFRALVLAATAFSSTNTGNGLDSRDTGVALLFLADVCAVADFFMTTVGSCLCNWMVAIASSCSRPIFQGTLETRMLSKDTKKKPIEATAGFCNNRTTEYS